jgi:AAA family ATP:ADP antiporter
VSKSQPLNSNQSSFKKFTTLFSFLNTPLLKDSTEKKKCFYLSVTFFLVVGAYTLAKELQGSVFAKIVGIEYVPIAKTLTMVALFPAILVYAYLVDHLKRYQLLSTYAIIYSVLGFILAYFLGYGDIGLANPETGPHRLFGWVFYFYIEGYSPYIVGVFWAFSNSVNKPDEANRTYSFIVAASKVGGMAASLIAYNLMVQSTFLSFVLDPVLKQQSLLLLSSVSLGLVPLVVMAMTRSLDYKALSGYKHEVEKNDPPVKKTIKGKKTGVWPGLKLLFQEPYVLGIFGLVFFFEVVNQVLNYQRLILAETQSTEICSMNAILYKQMFFVHFSGFFVALFGTTFLLRIFGTGRCLMLMPLLSLIFIGAFVVSGSINALIVAYIALHSMSYTLGTPVRESLYILTVKDIQFKSKSWIDSFGTKLAKSLGQQFNLFTSLLKNSYGLGAYTLANNVFLLSVLGAWVFTAYCLGKRYQKAIKNNEVIG